MDQDRLFRDGEKYRGGIPVSGENDGWLRTSRVGLEDFSPPCATRTPCEACIPGLLSEPETDQIILELTREEFVILHTIRTLIYNLAAPAQI